MGITGWAFIGLVVAGVGVALRRTGRLKAVGTAALAIGAGLALVAIAVTIAAVLSPM